LEALTGLEDESPSQDKLLMLSVLTENVSSINERLHESLLQRVLSTSLWWGLYKCVCVELHKLSAIQRRDRDNCTLYKLELCTGWTHSLNAPGFHNP
jgi:hypothetical protein